MWLVDVKKLINRYGQKEDEIIFNRLVERKLDCIMAEQLSHKLCQTLKKISINPKSKKYTPYTQYGYIPLGAAFHDLYDIN